jgi:hypothetical protein
MIMPKFVIERDITGAGKMSPAELKSISQKSCGVLSSMGPSVQWVHSYVTDDKIYCIYRAPSEDLIRRHAENAGFPANSVAKIHAVIDPTTAE